MIDIPDIVPLLIEASPGFAEKWAEFQAEWADEPPLPYYLVLADFARHMCGLLSAGDEQTLKRIFAVIERLLIKGSAYVKEAATIGLLEDLQNTNLHLPDTTPEQFERFLLPESARWWKKVRAFWEEGKIITND
ncbi:hypothetical protein TFLX_04269 [Thermoflexales bacterium]|nr:hypothetical protein TFLX_04269 [Thermoflexales bacterium]